VEIEFFQDGIKLITKRTSITTMGAKIQAFDIFQTTHSSHYPLPLKSGTGLPVRTDTAWPTAQGADLHGQSTLFPNNLAR
jgi:hypothetical protein